MTYDLLVVFMLEGCGRVGDGWSAVLAARAKINLPEFSSKCARSKKENGNYQKKFEPQYLASSILDSIKQLNEPVAMDELSTNLTAVPRCRLKWPSQCGYKCPAIELLGPTARDSRHDLCHGVSDPHYRPPDAAWTSRTYYNKVVCSQWVNMLASKFWYFEGTSFFFRDGTLLLDTRRLLSLEQRCGFPSLRCVTCEMSAYQSGSGKFCPKIERLKVICHRADIDGEAESALRTNCCNSRVRKHICAHCQSAAADYLLHRLRATINESKWDLTMVSVEWGKPTHEWSVSLLEICAEQEVQSIRSGAMRTEMGIFG
ncbi:uncharacterized protein MYCFIDRAFT_174487 [Pseudocercospora fijiensis CIRAD86]|uniref:Uncharacterized protein n=1 Tax=Pseudocercospora fijiensis (strain CIRAD86) TaxID=383855 RepID=M3AEG5_PSEFD|nr:uncharacterized protein MYCFIDRAFT_174487 [Pseudocercospora fijiensis CIRAD86]EME82986.1 hypothetical protein MYCFIDRAFT_174487 [Pseudocercospora fijiensis CIRAD86]